MFTGIIETIGTIKAIRTEGTNRHLEIASAISSELKVDQSVAHDGVCLTVTRVEEDHHWVTAVQETLARSALSDLTPGRKINLERCMLSNGRFDGHIVQGHVDVTGELKDVMEEEGSWRLTFGYPEKYAAFLVDKGSVTINGISLTCFAVTHTTFSVAIIPYTYKNTTIHMLEVKDKVNLEFDILGKYVQRILSLRNAGTQF